jgi:hypothetical protein
LLPKGPVEAGFDDFHREFRRSVPRRFRLAFQLSLFGATWVAPLLIGRPPPIWLYRRPTRERALAGMGDSRIFLLRQLFALLKSVVSLCYGADPDVRQAIGYPPRREQAPRV